MEEVYEKFSPGWQCGSFINLRDPEQRVLVDLLMGEDLIDGLTEFEIVDPPEDV